MSMRRVAVGALIAGLCLAAATAITALVTGEFDDTHARVIGSSLGFGVLSALGAAGAGLWRDASGGPRQLGRATAAAALVAFALLIGAIWLFDEEGVWRAFGVAGLLALWGSHASLVLRSRHRDDPRLVSALVWISIAGAAFDVLVADVALVGLVDEIEEGPARLSAAVLVAVILSTALPPLIRRLAGPPGAPGRDAFGRRGRDTELTMGDLADELIAAASRLDAAGSPADVRREAASLRRLAARARR